MHMLAMQRIIWPNPATNDGLPFIRKDGKRNVAQMELGDAKNAATMRKAVVSLVLADFLSPRSAYLKQASALLETWFIDPKTRMEPHLE